MAKIFPFRGVRYNPEKLTDMSLVVTQPYDKIKDKEREAYYKRHPYNYTRIIKGDPEPNLPDNNVYSRAAKYLQEWLQQNILIRDTEPALYVYHQTFTVNRNEFTRKGFMALVEVEEPGSSKVKAHEKTLAGPKADRLNLNKAVNAFTEHIFMLYPDPQNQVNAIFDPIIATMTPTVVATDDFGAVHKVWKITDTKVVQQVQAILDDKDLFIADGHHRYETSVNYWKEMKAKGVPEIGNESIRHSLMTLFSMEDPGLVVLATHRLIHSVPNFNGEEFLAKASVNFEIESFAFNDYDYASIKTARGRLYTELDNALGTNVFGVAIKGLNKYMIFRFKNLSAMDKLLQEPKSPEWKRLDVAVLHTAILDALLGIGAKALEAETNVVYERGLDDTLDRFNEEARFQLAFLINPTRVSEVKDVAANGERMPQKSTDFYPKLLSGLVFSLVNIS